MVPSVNHDYQCQGNAGSADSNYNGCKHKTMGQGVQVLSSLCRLIMSMGTHNNRNGCPPFFRRNGDIEQYYRPLEYIHSQKFFNEIRLANHCVKSYHHKQNIDPIIIFGYDIFNHLFRFLLMFSSCDEVLKNRDHDSHNSNTNTNLDTEHPEVSRLDSVYRQDLAQFPIIKKITSQNQAHPAGPSIYKYAKVVIKIIHLFRKPFLCLCKIKGN